VGGREGRGIRNQVASNGSTGSDEILKSCVWIKPEYINGGFDKWRKSGARRRDGIN